MKFKLNCLFYLFLSFSSEFYCLEKVFWRPKDNIRAELINVINQEKKGIVIALFQITDKKIVQALINANKRGVRVTAFIDPMTLKKPAGVSLAKRGINVFKFNSENMEGDPLMHNKIALFESNGVAGGGQLGWTGSFNWSTHASVANFENAIYFDDLCAINEYKIDVESLKLSGNFSNISS